ncbi:MAG TPA: hypothetical protein VFS29_01500 [Motilibacteraceae bacterium]|nr:hypothetical protein [Motilibacteraceae bacterium]
MGSRHWGGKVGGVVGVVGRLVPLLLAAVAVSGAVVLGLAMSTAIPHWCLALIGPAVFLGSVLIGWSLGRWLPSSRVARWGGLCRTRAERVRTSVHGRRVRRMSARRLGERWAASAVALAHEPSAAGRARIAARRAGYLSEMERRDPLGFARWMAEDPLATDPRGYLAPQGH